MVAPTLFATLDDRSLAGSIAGQMFHMEAYISVVCGGLLLLLQGVSGSAARRAGPRMWLIIGMLTLIAVSEWLIGPMLDKMPHDGREFAIWHGISALIYLAASLGGVALLVASRPVSSSSAA